MSDQRQPFRFRLPWLAPERPSAQQQRRRPTPRTPSQPPVSNPQSAWRLSGAAPPQPARQLPAKTDPRQPSPTSSRTVSKPSSAASTSAESTKTTSKPGAPTPPATETPKPTPPSTETLKPETRKPTSPATETPKPTPTATETPKPTPPATESSKPTPVAAKPALPSRVANEPPKAAAKPAQARSPSKAASVPSSPSKGDLGSKTGSTSQAQPEPRKPSQQPQSSARSASPKPAPSEGSPPKARQKEPEVVAKPSAAQEEPKAEPVSTAAKSTSSKDDAAVRESQSLPASKVIAAEPGKDQKLGSSEGGDRKPPEVPKEETAREATTIEEPTGKVIIEAPSFNNESKDIRVSEFQHTKRQQKREAPGRKETVTTSSFIGKQIKTSAPSTEGNESVAFQSPAGEAAPRQREIKEGISKLIGKLANSAQLDENQVTTVITLTGENKGASMYLTAQHSAKEAPIHIHRGYKTDPDDSAGTATDGESPGDRKRLDAQIAPQPKAYVNSNTQGLNNSIVFEASVAERNPGVHMFLNLNTSEGSKAKGSPELIQARRAECRATASERLTHESTVRRRCLRGLFMKSSDSDLDNPNKPRRHGCRYSRADKEFM